MISNTDLAEGHFMNKSLNCIGVCRSAHGYARVCLKWGLTKMYVPFVLQLCMSGSFEIYVNRLASRHWNNVKPSSALPWGHPAPLTPDFAATTPIEMWGKEGECGHNFSGQTDNTMEDRASCNHDLCNYHNIQVDLWIEIRSFPILPHPSIDCVGI